MQGAGNFTIQNGALGASGSEVIVHQFGTGLLTISSSISGGAGSLVKDGSGTLTLTGPQNYATLATGAGITNLNVALGTGSSTINANARTNISTSQTLAALNIGGNGVVVLSAAAGTPLPGFLEDGSASLEEPGDAGSALLADDLLAPVAGVTEWNEQLPMSGVDSLASGSPQAVPEPGCVALLPLALQSRWGKAGGRGASEGSLLARGSFFNKSLIYHRRFSTRLFQKASLSLCLCCGLLPKASPAGATGALPASDL